MPKALLPDYGQEALHRLRAEKRRRPAADVQRIERVVQDKRPLPLQGADFRSEGIPPDIAIRRRDFHGKITVEAPAGTERGMHIDGSNGAAVRRRLEDPDRMRCRRLHQDARRNRIPDSCTTSPPTWRLVSAASTRADCRSALDARSSIPSDRSLKASHTRRVSSSRPAGPRPEPPGQTPFPPGNPTMSRKPSRGPARTPRAR